MRLTTVVCALAGLATLFCVATALQQAPRAHAGPPTPAAAAAPPPTARTVVPATPPAAPIAAGPARATWALVPVAPPASDEGEVDLDGEADLDDQAPREVLIEGGCLSAD